MNHINEQLSQYYCTEAYHRSFIPGVMYTDGAKAFADLANAYWVLDDIAAVVKLEPQVKKEDFVTADVISNNGSAEIVYDDGDGNVLFNQEYPSTDLLQGKYTFFISGGVIYLPSEH